MDENTITESTPEVVVPAEVVESTVAPETPVEAAPSEEATVA